MEKDKYSEVKVNPSATAEYGTIGTGGQNKVMVAPGVKNTAPSSESTLSYAPKEPTKTYQRGDVGSQRVGQFNAEDIMNRINGKTSEPLRDYLANPAVPENKSPEKVIGSGRRDDVRIFSPEESKRFKDHFAAEDAKIAAKKRVEEEYNARDKSSDRRFFSPEEANNLRSQLDALNNTKKSLGFAVFIRSNI